MQRREFLTAALTPATLAAHATLTPTPDEYSSKLNIQQFQAAHLKHFTPGWEQDAYTALRNFWNDVLVDGNGASGRTDIFHGSLEVGTSWSNRTLRADSSVLIPEEDEEYFPTDPYLHNEETARANHMAWHYGGSQFASIQDWLLHRPVTKLELCAKVNYLVKVPGRDTGREDINPMCRDMELYTVEFSKTIMLPHHHDVKEQQYEAKKAKQSALLNGFLQYNFDDIK